jgi:hypothetical protein
MARVLNRSDIYLIRSDRHATCVVRGAAQTSPPACGWPAPARANTARFTDRDLQALRSAELPLRRRTWARPEAISVHNQPNRRATTTWLRAECEPRSGCRVSWQFSRAAANAQRDLCDQRRASAPSRESRLDGSGRHRPRRRQGGRHPRQHDRSLSCWWRSAVQPGGSRS